MSKRGQPVDRDRRRGPAFGAVVAGAESLGALQSTWFELRELPWRSLSVVPAEEEVSVLEVSAALAAVARRFEGTEVLALDGRMPSLDDCRARIEEIGRLTQKGARVIVAVQHPLSHPLAVPVVRATDAAVLIVALESTRIKEARAVLARVGEDRFLGAMSMRVRRGRSGRRRGGRAEAMGEPVWADLAATTIEPSAGRPAAEEKAT